MIPIAPRLIAPRSAAPDEVFQVKTIISHQMETGLRRDPEGQVIPRHIINRFRCSYNGEVVFSVDLHESIAANPYLEFFLRASESGRIEAVWEEDGGGIYRLEHQITVE